MKFKHRNIMGAIYCCLLAIPFVSILARTIYTQSNKNAYLSYSGTQTLNTYTVTNDVIGHTNSVGFLNELTIGNYYEYNGTLEHLADSLSYLTGQLIPTNYYLIEFELLNFEIDTTFNHLYQDDYWTDFVKVDNMVTFGMDINSDEWRIYLITQTYMGLFNEQDLSDYVYYLFDDPQETYYVEMQLKALTIDYVLIDPLDQYEFEDTHLFTNATFEVPIYSYETVESSTLDNAFEYSMKTFVQDNNFGKLNLFQWFTNIFMNDNPHNALYIGFVNWYMNFVLLVSCAYILFLVLMWFINFSRRILERGMNYDW